MKQTHARNIEFFHRDRRLSVAVEKDIRFEFLKSVQHELREAKRYERRRVRRSSPDMIAEQMEVNP